MRLVFIHLVTLCMHLFLVSGRTKWSWCDLCSWPYLILLGCCCCGVDMVWFWIN